MLRGFSFAVAERTWRSGNMTTRPLPATPAYVQQTEKHLYPGLRKAGIPEQ
jgi:hypothetical protein